MAISLFLRLTQFVILLIFHLIFTATLCSDLELGLAVVEVSNGGTEVGAVRNFTCGDGAQFMTINTSHTVVRCEAHGDWVTYTGERADNSIEDCIPKKSGDKSRRFLP